MLIYFCFCQVGESFSEDVSAQCSGGRYLKFLNSSLPAAGLVWFFTPEEKREFDSRLALSGLFYVLSFPTPRKKPAEKSREWSPWHWQQVIKACFFCRMLFITPHLYRFFLDLPNYRNPGKMPPPTATARCKIYQPWPQVET